MKKETKFNVGGKPVLKKLVSETTLDHGPMQRNT
jgi:hypothetical protein